ncbi:MAG: peptidylprolyl isomerase [Ignavibacteriae bacterium]|nr:peptidylprolyl isomerase [Ignavibacteriota bacterium]MCB9242046.1 peptidylprolyl isomerase [Ignavibacteriales bacterium]
MLKGSLVTLALVLFTCMVLIACGDKKNETSGTTNKTDQTTTTSNTTQTKTDGTMTDTTKKEEATDKKSGSESDIVVVETNMGTFKIKLFSEKAPITTSNFRDLVEKGFYNGITFHRVIDGFMIQGGDPTGTGTGGSDKTIPDEFDKSLRHNKAGILSMANRGPNTGTSQFFITLAPQPHLDDKHAVFGEVTEGMDVIKAIGKVETGPGDKPVTPVVMEKVYMEE